MAIKILQSRARQASGKIEQTVKNYRNVMISPGTGQDAATPGFDKQNTYIPGVGQGLGDRVALTYTGPDGTLWMTRAARRQRVLDFVRRRRATQARKPGGGHGD